jgi:hypothetical protein
MTLIALDYTCVHVSWSNYLSAQISHNLEQILVYYLCTIFPISTKTLPLTQNSSHVHILQVLKLCVTHVSSDPISCNCVSFMQNLADLL